MPPPAPRQLSHPRDGLQRRGPQPVRSRPRPRVNPTGRSCVGSSTYIRPLDWCDDRPAGFTTNGNSPGMGLAAFLTRERSLQHMPPAATLSDPSGFYLMTAATRRGLIPGQPESICPSRSDSAERQEPSQPQLDRGSPQRPTHPVPERHERSHRQVTQLASFPPGPTPTGRTCR